MSINQRLRFSLFGLFLAAVIIGMLASNFATSLKIRSMAAMLHPPVKSSMSPGTLQVQYHRFVLFKHDGDLYALHMIPDPRHGRRADFGVLYHWFHLAHGEREFYAGKGSNRRGSPALSAGSGQARETHSPGARHIEIGQLSIPWSCGNQRQGWLYFGEVGDFEVYQTQFESLEECQGDLDDDLWMQVK